MEQYLVINKDCSTIDVMDYIPFLVIDGIGYKTEYEACEKLNALGNIIGNLDF